MRQLFFLKRIQQGISFTAQERFRFHFAGLEDGDRCAGLAVIGNIQVVNGNIGLAEAVEDFVQTARRIAHFDGDDFVHMTLVAGFLQFRDSQFRIGDDEADDAEFCAVIGQHGVDIDIGIG